jgi:hypothetical protein
VELRPFISGGPLEGLSQGDYDVFVGAVSETELDQYLVINRTTGVVEFKNEVKAFVIDWLAYFVDGKIPAAVAEQIGQADVVDLFQGKKAN